MTNPQNSRPEDEVEQATAPEVATDEEAPVAKKQIELTADDLMLTPTAPRVHRDRVESHGDELTPILVAPPAHHHHHRKKKSLKRRIFKVLLIILIVLLCLAVIAASTLFALHQIGKNELLNTENVVLTAPEIVTQDPQVTVSDDGRAVTYKGEKYVFNENRTNILCIGMDQAEMGGNSIGTAGQADALILLSIDTATGQTDALAISRDSLVDIDLYRTDGSFYGVENTQICLAYAYGDGRETSCENVVKAASRLLYGIPINTYFSIDLSAIPILNDAVGGVTVTLPSDFSDAYGYHYSAGQTITLYGKNAEKFVRTRNTALLDSNLDRMARQKAYILSFFNTALEATKNDLQVPLQLFDAVSANSITTLNASRITYLATTLVQHNSELQFHSVPGEVVQGEDGYAEYHVDEAALYEQILQLFYTKTA